MFSPFKKLFFSRRILYKEPPIPHRISSTALDLILRLLDKNPQKRLGCGDNGIMEIKNHAFYKVAIESNQLVGLETKHATREVMHQIPAMIIVSIF